ncbi:hypothetical protein ASD24_24490 [Paenibacillus sp. Root52]|uniref:hypothetical protein n=1 Tax=Paenibacillus sp. Root52 TaxID=1736552 RepID=UPI0006F88472|nr:hypothetical protein [Paenibacillus sp. Root52]KQY90958.1 hypothetical protein ASD24_24490 [Paenibacillus sp. Root52]
MELKKIQIDKEHAEKLGQIMLWISEMGADSVERNEAVEHCIDLTFNVLKNRDKTKQTKTLAARSVTKVTEVQKVLPWVCDSCGNRWVDSLLICWGNCPECEGEAFHESARAVKIDDVWYTND